VTGRRRQAPPQSARIHAAGNLPSRRGPAARRDPVVRLSAGRPLRHVAAGPRAVIGSADDATSGGCPERPPEAWPSDGTSTGRSSIAADGPPGPLRCDDR
jgi:hypothetical protein